MHPNDERWHAFDLDVWCGASGGYLEENLDRASCKGVGGKKAESSVFGVRVMQKKILSQNVGPCQ